jgi:hypothetical protein
LENLIDLHGDIVFIKNIDNVVPDRLKETTYRYKKALGGLLCTVQRQIFDYLNVLSSGTVSHDLLRGMSDFSTSTLSIILPTGFPHWTPKDQASFFFERFHRPLRVCGMVRNTGEPGGGPFWVQGSDGSLSLQIVESSQVDPDLPDQQAILKSSTHFNPVDMVCGIRDFRGTPFDLHDFTNPKTGFISIKSHEGRKLKALELPGLWNGAMAHWNTIFVEVPPITFNPVKTFLDLLRPEHQPSS